MVFNLVRPSHACLSSAIFSSLSGDGCVRSNGNVLADATEAPNGVIELLRGVDALSHGKRVGVVKELHLGSASFTIVDGTHTRILLVEPRALNISLLLRVIGLGVDLAHKVRDLLDSLFFGGADIVASHHLLRLLEVLSGIGRCFWAPLAEVVPVFSAEVASTVAGLVSGNHSSEALGCSLHRPINEGELRDVVLVDHAKDGLLLANVDFRVLNVLLVRRLQFPLHMIKSIMTLKSGRVGHIGGNLRIHRHRLGGLSLALACD